MKRLTILFCITSYLSCENFIAKESISFIEFSAERVQDAGKEIDQLYASKNKKATGKIAGIGLVAALGAYYYFYSGQNTPAQADPLQFFADNTSKKEMQKLLSSSLFAATTSGITWCIKDIYAQFSDKPEYDYFKKSFYYFDVHLARIKYAAEACEKENDSKNLPFFRSELILSFNDMVNSLEEIVGVIDFISAQEKIKSERIVFYKKYLVEQVALLGKNLDSLLAHKKENSFIAVTREGTTEIYTIMQKTLTLYPKLNELQKEITMAQRIKRMENKIDAMGNFLITQAERK